MDILDISPPYDIDVVLEDDHMAFVDYIETGKAEAVYHMVGVVVEQCGHSGK